MVNVVPDTDPVIVAGNPVTEAPVAVPPSVKPMLTGLFIQTVGEALPEDRVIFCPCIVIVPVALEGIHVPVVVTV